MNLFFNSKLRILNKIPSQFPQRGLIDNNIDSGYALAPSVNKPSTEFWQSL